jgi:hypothetical protein
VVFILWKICIQMTFSPELRHCMLQVVSARNIDSRIPGSLDCSDIQRINFAAETLSRVKFADSASANEFGSEALNRVQMLT